MNLQVSDINWEFYIIIILIFNSCQTGIKNKQDEECSSENKNHKIEYIKDSTLDEDVLFVNQLNEEIINYIQTRITFDSIDGKNFTFVIEFTEDHYSKPFKENDTVIKLSTYNCDVPYEGYRGVFLDQEFVVALFDRNGFSNHLIKDSMLVFTPIEELICNEEFLILTNIFVVYNKKLYKWVPGKPKPYKHYSF